MKHSILPGFDLCLSRKLCSFANCMRTKFRVIPPRSRIYGRVSETAPTVITRKEGLQPSTCPCFPSSCPPPRISANEKRSRMHQQLSSMGLSANKSEARDDRPRFRVPRSQAAWREWRPAAANARCLHASEGCC
eukprot:2530671-Rhodomonas_salina.3